LTIGLCGAYFLSTAMAALLVGVDPRDEVTFVAISALLSAVALAACLLATRRATQLDPLVALRTGSGS